MIPTAVVFLYLAIVLYIGVFAFRAAARRVDAEEYFLAGRSLGPAVFLLSPFGTNMTAFSILGALTARLNGAALRPALRRGMLAALLSGAAFYGTSGIWFPFNPRGWDYAVHFGAWTLAYAPGFGALLIARRQNARS